MKRGFSFLFLLAAVGCAHGSVLDPKSQSVVEVVCRYILLHAKEAPEGNYLLVENRTIPFALSEGDADRAKESGIPGGLLLQLLDARPRHITLPSGDQLRPIAPATIKEIFAGGPRWDQFYTRFPNSRGFVELSGPVFSEDGAEALLYLDYNCYGDCGWGSVVHLKNENGRWVQIHEWLRYIS